MSVGSHRRGRPLDELDRSRRFILLRPRDWRVRTKLAAALVVPSLAFLVLAGMQTASVATGATALDEFAGQVELARQSTALVHELQEERDRTLGELAALGSEAQSSSAGAQIAEVMFPIYRSVDARVSAFEEAASKHRSGSASWRSALADVSEQVDQLGRVRAGVFSGILSSTTVTEAYKDAIDALLHLLGQPSPGEGEDELSQAVLAYVELAQAKEINSLVRQRLFMVAGVGRYSGTDRVDLSDLYAQQLAAISQFRAAATYEQVRLYEQTLAVPEVQEAGKLEEDALAVASTGRLDLDSMEWWRQSTAKHNLVREVEAKLVDNAVRLADSASLEQWRQTALFTATVMLVLFVAVATSVGIGRSMAQSLRQLRGQALIVAQTQLPQLLENLRQITPADPQVEVEAPTVRSADEFGEVADAFHAVHRSAVHLAVEQAMMRRNVNAIFVSLARRSQVLVERQLELLDRLEQAEGDPELLSNLFQLDHLAARMRRNDDNLLVLAGSEPRRRWREPVALSTVVVAAVAEIEEYPRIQHDIDDQIYVIGLAIGDLAHLFAELLENATQFSPSDSPVHVTGRRAPGGQGALVEIVDTGMGMRPQALAEMNKTLAAPAPVDVAAAERMGLVVVSHLAARQGVRVKLAPTPADPRGDGSGGGLTAAVWLPPELLAPASTGAEPFDLPVSGIPAQTAQLQIGASPQLAGVLTVEAPVVRPGAPARAESVLGAGGRTAWWSRQPAEGPAEPARSGGSLPAGPPEIPITGGTNARGLPVRVPMAQLPSAGVPDSDDGQAGDTGSSDGRRAAQRHVDLDPEAVGGALARFYRGVRQAQKEDVVVPVFRTGDGGQDGQELPGAAAIVDQPYEEE